MIYSNTFFKRVYTLVHDPHFQKPLVEKIEANGKLILITKISRLCQKK